MIVFKCDMSACKQELIRIFHLVDIFFRISVVKSRIVPMTPMASVKKRLTALPNWVIKYMELWQMKCCTNISESPGVLSAITLSFNQFLMRDLPTSI